MRPMPTAAVSHSSQSGSCERAVRMATRASLSGHPFRSAYMRSVIAVQLASAPRRSS